MIDNDWWVFFFQVFQTGFLRLKIEKLVSKVWLWLFQIAKTTTNQKVKKYRLKFK